MTLLREKVCLITGASRGIGRASAELFAAHGAHLILSSRHAASLEIVSAACSSAGAASVMVQPCDVSDEGQVRALFQAAFQRHHGLHVLMANAGILEDALIGMVTPAMIDRMFRTNVYGTLYCAQYGSRLIARSGGGSIITLASIVGERGSGGHSVYAGTKAAITAITRSLAKELAPQSIRVNAIAPGLIDTAMTEQLPENKRAAVLAAIGCGRIGAVADVANVALFLASDLSSYVTGQVVGVDGAMVI
jgi:3-oxoacyl-[acyl-carrier protein] reductase